uniref:Uncharacterized protein n=1 Tax=Ditylenchus dipsaci TaxID=166011 RepID=A0A915DBE8_9BILA
MLLYVVGALFALWVCYEIDRTRKRDGKSRIPILGLVFDNISINVHEEVEKSRMQSIAKKEHHHKNKSDHDKKSDHHKKKSDHSDKGKKKKDKKSASKNKSEESKKKKKGKKSSKNESKGSENKKDGDAGPPAPEGSTDVNASQPSAPAVDAALPPSTEQPKNAN